MRTTNIAMIAIGVLAVALAIVVPGFQITIVVLGGALAGWGSYGLLSANEQPNAG